MPYDPRRHHRRSIRLRGYDYAQAGAYFVTICANHRVCLFGEVADGEMIPSSLGRIVAQCWDDIPRHVARVSLDAAVVMPNHIHGIVLIEHRVEEEGTACRAPTSERFGRPVSGSLPTVVRSFKAASTRLINEQRGTPGQTIWQRNYYEHVIRNEASLTRLRDYIAANPARWAEDQLHPENPSRW